MTRSRIKWRVNSREPNSNLQKYTHWRVDKKKKKKPVFKKPKPWVVLVIHVTSWNRYENDDETVTGTPVCQCQRVDMCYCFSVNFFALILKEKYLWDPQNIEHSFMLSRRWLVIIYNWSKFLMKNCLIYADKRNNLICSCFVLTGTSWMFLSTFCFLFTTEFLQKQPVRL